MNPTQILQEEKRYQTEVLKKKKIDIEKGIVKTEEINGKLKRISVKYDKLESLYDEKMNSISSLEVVLQAKLKKQEEERIIMNLGPPSDDIRSFVFVGIRIFDGSYSSPEIERYKVSKNGKMIDNLVKICESIVFKLIDKTNLMKTAQVELTTFNIRNNKTLKDLKKQGKKWAMCALSVEYKDSAYSFMVPHDDSYTFKDLKEDALVYFELPAKVFSLVDQYNRTWQSSTSVYAELKYIKEKYNLTSEQEADSFVIVKLIEKIKLDYSAEIYKLYRTSAKDILTNNTENDYQLYNDNLTKKVYKSRGINLETLQGSESQKILVHPEGEISRNKDSPNGKLVEIQHHDQILGVDSDKLKLGQVNEEYLDSLYAKHQKNAKSLFVYILLFLSVALGIYLTEDTEEINHSVRMVHGKLFSTAFPTESKAGIHWPEIATIEDVDNWIAYSTTQLFRNIWYNGQPYNVTEANNLFLVNSFIGVSRVLQKKVKDLTCPAYAIPSLMGPEPNANGVQICYPKWSESDESQEPIFISYPPSYSQLIFDAGIVSLYYGLDPAYNETVTNDTQRQSIFNLLTNSATYRFYPDYARLIRFEYTQGGFEVFLNKNSTTSIEYAEGYNILRKTWYTAQTRLITMNLNFYTPATDIFVAVETVFQIDVSGTINKVNTIQASRVYYYWSSNDIIHMLFEAITLIFVIKMFFNFANIYYKEGSYIVLSDPYNIIELMVSLIFLLKVVLNVVIFLIPGSRKIKFDSREYVDLTDILVLNSVMNMSEGFLSNFSNNSVSFTAILIFRYFKYSNILWKLFRTLKNSLKLILLFMFLIIIVSFTLAISIHILFGQFLNELSNFYNAETTILLLIASCLLLN